MVQYNLRFIFLLFWESTLTLKYDLDKASSVSKIKRKLLGSLGTTINITWNNQYPHPFLNVLLLYRTIVTEVTQQKFVKNAINYYTEKLNHIGLLKLNCLLKLLDIKTQATQISFLKTKILKGNNGLIIESRLLIVDKKIHRLILILIESATNPHLDGLSHIKSTLTRLSHERLFYK